MKKKQHKNIAIRFWTLKKDEFFSETYKNIIQKGRKGTSSISRFISLLKLRDTSSSIK